MSERKQWVDELIEQWIKHGVDGKGPIDNATLARWLGIFGARLCETGDAKLLSAAIEAWAKSADAGTLMRWVNLMRKRMSDDNESRRLPREAIRAALRACKPGDALYRQPNTWDSRDEIILYFVRYDGRRQQIVTAQTRQDALAGTNTTSGMTLKNAVSDQWGPIRPSERPMRKAGR